MTRQNDINALLAAHGRRLQKLQETQARLGVSTPAEVLTEIDEIEATMAGLEAELAALQTDHGAIAASTSEVLVSYLARSGNAPSPEGGEALYQHLTAYFKERPAAQEILGDLKEAPHDADLQAALRVQLKKLLVKDGELAAQLAGLLTNARGRTSGTTINQTAGDKANQFGQVFGDVTIE